MPKPRNTKKFIDKKNAVTFHLVHRSQQDPLITDETAPQRVLVESDAVPQQGGKIDVVKRKKEQQKYGVFFDDEYDYLQHLRVPESQNVAWEYVSGPKPIDKTVDERKKPLINLPSSVFASEFEEKEGLLRKSAPRHGPRPDWDPDIVAALDDDFDFENPQNELDDNFMEMAMEGVAADEGSESGAGSDSEYSDIDSNFDDDDGEERDALGPLRMHATEETKSRFTEYSMSSSVIRRNEQLALLDERFEKFFENYDEPDIGPLDCEEIEGHVEINDDLLSQCMVELKRDDEIEPYNKQWDRERIKKLEADNSDEELVELEIEAVDKKKWDCESILSTYSNIYNHPKMIDEPRRHSTIKINPKTGVPLNVFHGENAHLTVKSLAKFDTENRLQSSRAESGPKSVCAQSVLSTLSVLSIRPPDETAEEKVQRKRLLREYRHERRIERKANALAFKEEQKRQTKIKMNNRNNLQGNKIV